jgi:hypothetical protein
MLIVVMEDRLFPPEQVCHSCLLADGKGQPRWYGGQLRCGQVIHKCGENKCVEEQPEQYECAMGFRIANIR